jgi:hypothetical protein
MELDKFETNAEIQDLFFNFNGIGKDDFKEEKKRKKRKNKNNEEKEEEKNEPYMIKGQVYKKKKIKKIYTDEEQLEEYKKQQNKKNKKREKKEEKEESEIEDEIEEISDKDMEKIDVNYHKLDFTKEEKKEMKEKNNFFKKPYNAHGWKYTNDKIKLYKIKESDNDENNFVQPYKEKIFMREKNINLFPVNINKTERPKTTKIKRTFHYLEPVKKKEEKKNKYSDYEESEYSDDYNSKNNDDDIDKEKVKLNKKLIKDNSESFQRTKEVLNDMKNIMSKNDYDKLIGNLGTNNFNDDEFFEEENNLNGDNLENFNENNVNNEKEKYEELQNKIKEEIKKSGNFNFNKLSTEEHDLITKMKLYKSIEKKKIEKEEKEKKKEKNKKRPKSSIEKINKDKIINDKKLENKDKNIYRIINKNKNDLISNPNNKFNFFSQTFTKQPIIKKQFIGCESQEINNNLNYIPKAGMNGFLVHSYNKNKEYTNKYNFKSVFVNETEDFIPPIPFKAKKAPNFKKIFEKKKYQDLIYKNKKINEINKQLNDILNQENQMNHPFLPKE